MPEERDWERPAILVELSGPDSGLVLERGAELLRSMDICRRKFCVCLPVNTTK